MAKSSHFCSKLEVVSCKATSDSVKTSMTFSCNLKMKILHYINYNYKEKISLMNKTTCSSSNDATKNRKRSHTKMYPKRLTLVSSHLLSLKRTKCENGASHLLHELQIWRRLGAPLMFEGHLRIYQILQCWLSFDRSL